MKTKTNIAKLIDHTNLKPDASEEDIAKLIAEAKEYGFNSVCIRPEWLEKFAGQYRSSAVIDFPKAFIEIKNPEDIKLAKEIIGNSSFEEKFSAARAALELGAVELDPVLGVGNLFQIEAELRGYIELMHEKNQELWLKPIFSCEILTYQEIEQSIESFSKEVSRHITLYPDSKLKFAYKNSTGFIRHSEPRQSAAQSGEAIHTTSVELINFIAEKLKQNDPAEIIRIKAAGGIRDFATAKLIINAAQGRLSHIGTSSGSEICK